MIRIERLHLDATGLSPVDGAQLADLVAQALGRAAATAPGRARDVVLSGPLRVDVRSAGPGACLATLADRIAGAVLAAIEEAG